MSGPQNEKFCLRWNDFETNISHSFQELRDDKDFFDVTLACEGHQLEAHKVILSACSPFFRTVFKKNPHQHPLLFLRGVQYSELVAVLDFMYHGEVNVAQEDLNSFLAVAEDLSVKGLTQNNSKKEEDKTPNSSVKRDPVKRQINHKTDPVERPSKQMKVTNSQNFSNSSGSDFAQHSGSPSNHVVSRQNNQEIREITPAPNLNIKTESQDQVVVLEDNDESYQEDQSYEYEQGYEHVEQSPSMQFDNNPLAVPSGTPGTIGESSQGDPDFCEFEAYVAENSSKVPGTRSLQCLICQKVTIHIGNMKQHFEVHHYHRSYKCNVCQRNFKTKNSLDVHKKTQGHYQVDQVTYSQ